MVRNLVKVTVLPCMFGILFFSSSTELNKTYDFSHYATDGVALDYRVPFEEEIMIETPPKFDPTPLVLKNYTGFKEALAFKESQGNYRIVNKFGYMGKYQFGQTTLDVIGIDSHQNFLKNPILQEQAFLLNASRNKWVLRRDIKRFANRWIAGIKITESGILAAAHLAGPGSVKKFLRSGGEIGFSDAFGTSIRSYLKRFSGYDVSNIKAVKRPSIKQLRLVSL
ncbi:transglycosylase family protein [Dokdonia sp. Hel_I_53]|uniref:transglycosylase family protein n=1 Tax=Dokdonia sp. Hel_I_53 TaxID=1566287 RepID=UPI00119B60EB|nr:transglycosylase family protein [Dokdonia sp. Hel_I_53]TVZ50963.1 hypothetical protein OD90_0097 [Dokdonia sp. Hel_I_53]